MGNSMQFFVVNGMKDHRCPVTNCFVIAMLPVFLIAGVGR